MSMILWQILPFYDFAVLYNHTPTESKQTAQETS